ncbi:hypothetical protein Ddc_12061 [Ditylenchus destructor]|nr:hypothetical protein Ddc_12061 [Ditylenchus destructor]
MEFSQAPPTSDVMHWLNRKFEKYFVKDNSITNEQWQRGLPGPIERHQMRKLIRTIFALPNFDSIASGRHPSILRSFGVLARSVSVSVIGRERQFCVIHENVDPITGKFPRYWGYVVIASKSAAKLPYLHHSASHFLSDGDVCNQAATLFEKTQSRSLVVAGGSRFAVKSRIPSPCQRDYEIADASHNSDTMFHHMNIGVWEATLGRNSERNNRRQKDVFVQWHGMKASSNSDIFASAGGEPLNSVYLDQNSPVNKIVSAVIRINASQYRVNTPKTDRNCKFKGTDNVFGRLVNGVSPSKVCSTIARSNDITGSFVQIEQRKSARHDLRMWTNAFKIAFPLD